MNVLQLTSRKTIKYTFKLYIWVLQVTGKMEPHNKKVAALRLLPDETLGKQIANCLDEHNLKLVPRYESHDLKHVLLDYKMTPEDEIRLQAFLLGNGNYTIPCFLILAFGLTLLPDCWSAFYTDYKKGRNTMPITNWTIDEYATKNLAELRETLAQPYRKVPVFTLKKVTQIGAYASTFGGILGMSICLPFLFSSSMEDLVGAGFPFIGAAILAVGGLLAMVNLANKNTPQEAVA